MTLMQVRPLSDNADFREAFAREAALIEPRAYVVADAYTHAPITPYAPIPGRMGIRADIARDMPGMDALRIEDVSPGRRHAFADHLERMARVEADASDRASARYWEYRAAGNEAGMANSLARANRAAEESDRLSDRAHYIRRAIVSGE